MSLGRDRSGGTATVTPLSRKYRSSRKRPRATSTSRSRLVAATTRTSTGTARVPPTRVSVCSWSTRSSRAWLVVESSPTSSSSSVPLCAERKRPGRAPLAPENEPRA